MSFTATNDVVGPNDSGQKETEDRRDTGLHPGKDESVAQTALTTSDSPQDEEVSTQKRKETLNEFEVALKSEETSSCRESTVDIHVITETILAGTRKRPRSLVNYLNEMYQEGPRLFVDLSDEPPPVTVLQAFDYQLIHLPWSNSHSPVPSVAKALEFCYILSAWDHQCVILCENGKRKTAPMVAAILKFSNKANRCYEGFCHFLERRCSIPKPDEILLPASLNTFFENFDTAVDMGRCMNSRPMKLETIALQGVPVEECPCVDVWDTTGHIFTSNSSIDTHWVDEEGFFPIHTNVQGDFCLTCRFGGAYASDKDDASKVLFQYCNSTAFMKASDPYELPATHVDLSQRYASQLVENFLLTLTFDEESGGANSEDTCQVDGAVPTVFAGIEARETGWQLITSKHPVNPSEADIDKMIDDAMGELEACPRHVVSLSLQLTNFDSTMALTLLLEGWLRNWWQQDTVEVLDQQTIHEPIIIDPYVALDNREVQEKIQTVLENLGTLHGHESDRASSEVGGDHFSVDYPSPFMKLLPGDVATSKLTSFRLSSILNESSLLLDEQPVAPFFLKHGKAHTPNNLEDIENVQAFQILKGMEHAGVTLSDLLGVPENYAELSENNNLLHLVSGSLEPEAIKSGDNNPESQMESSQDQSPTHVTAASSESQLRNGMLTGMKANDQDPKQTFSASTAVSRGGLLLESLPRKQIDGIDDQRLETGKEAANVTGIAGLAAAAALRKQCRNIDNANGIAGLTVSNATEKKIDDSESGVADNGDSVAVIAHNKESANLKATTEEALSIQSPDSPLKEDPKYQKYFNMLKTGLPRGAVKNAMQRDQVDSFILDLDPEKCLASQTEHEQNLQFDDPPLKSDPKFGKYFKMLKTGLPRGAVLNALQRDGVDEAIIDLDPEKSLKAQRSGTDDGLPLRDDPSFQKYSTGVKANDQDPNQSLPSSAEVSRGSLVLESISGKQLDGIDDQKLETGKKAADVTGIAGLAAAAALKKQSGGSDSAVTGIAGLAAAAALKKQGRSIDNANGIAGLTVTNAIEKKIDDSESGVADNGDSVAVIAHNKESANLKATTEEALSIQSPDCPLKEDPKYQKYFKMLKMGLPRGAVENAMQRDQVDSFILDLDPEKNLASQTEHEQNLQCDDPPLKSDPKFEKYFKMLKMGLPRGAVLNALQRDGVDEAIIDLDPEKSLKAQRSETDDGLPLRDDPSFQKYFKMLKMGLPDGAVRNAMQRDGIDPSILDLDHNKSLKSQREQNVEDDGVAIKDDPAFAKYFKMMKMGLPDGAVRNAMQRDGVDSSILDLDHNRSLKSQRGPDEKADNGVPIKDDPMFSKYFKMLKMGLPMGAVRNSMERDGVDSSVLDLRS